MIKCRIDASICPKCGSFNVRVCDSRHRSGTVKRRRECEDCGHKYSTYEMTEIELKQLETLMDADEILSRLKDIVKWYDGHSGGI